jgi:hypothetical protein
LTRLAKLLALRNLKKMKNLVVKGGGFFYFSRNTHRLQVLGKPFLPKTNAQNKVITNTSQEEL